MPAAAGNEQPGILGDALKIFDLINQSYAVITQGPNTGRILCTADPFEPTLLTDSRFHTALAGMYRIKGEKDNKAASRMWVHAPMRRNVHGLVFEPTGSPVRVRSGVFNYWQGWRVEPCGGDAHALFLEHLERIVCGGDPKLFAWFLAFLADLVQQPGKKPGVGAVLFSPEHGTGKSIVAKAVQAMTAPYATSISKIEHLTGRFNAALAHRVFVACEETRVDARAPDWGTLRDLVTADTAQLEHKGCDPVQVSNHARLLFTLNHEKHLPVEYGDRRWAVFRVLPDRKGDFDYFGRIDGTIDDGSLPACLLHFLLNHRFEKNALRQVPMTVAKAERIVETLSAPGRWWFHQLTGGDADAFAGKPIPKTALYSAFSNCATVQRPYAATDERVFWRDLRKLAAFSETRRGENRERHVTFPDLSGCREQFSRHIDCNLFGSACDA